MTATEPRPAPVARARSPRVRAAAAQASIKLYEYDNEPVPEWLRDVATGARASGESKPDPAGHATESPLGIETHNRVFHLSLGGQSLSQVAATTKLSEDTVLNILTGSGQPHPDARNDGPTKAERFENVVRSIQVTEANR